MTMVLPFALVIDNGGGSLWFIFLSIYANLCPLYFYHESLLSTSSNIDRSIDFDCSIDVAGSSNVNVTRRRRQWDPGITKHAQRSMATPPWIDLGADFRDDFVLTMMASSGLAIWDPGIASCAIVGTMGMPVYFEVFRRRPPVLLHASIGSMSSYVDRDCHDGLLLYHASVFHYCHPVLSRPTVPNIDI